MRLPLVTRATALALAAGLAVTGCTGPSDDSSSTSPSRPSSTEPPDPASTASTATTVEVTGLPTELSEVLTTLYTGGDVPATESAAAALAGRTPAQGTVTVTGSTGTARGAEVAVAVMQDDVTLAVADPAAGGGWRVVGGWWPSIGVAETAVGGRPKLVAVIGSDARPGEDAATALADSLHLVGLDDTGAGGVVGIPRDSWVPLPRGGEGKLNSALSGGGPEAQLAALEQVSGLDLQGYMITGFAGFTSMIEALGGVSLSLDRALQDPAADLDLPPGEQELSGEDALAFSRTRKILPRGDIDRQLNGGRVLLAAGAALQLAGPEALPRLLEAADAHLVTDLTAEQLLTLMAATLRTDPARVPNVVVPARVGTVGEASVVFLEPGAADVFADLADGALTP